MFKKQENRKRRKLSIRRKIEGSGSKPRLSVYRSNKHIYAQVIDDEKKVTIASASDLKAKKGSKTERARQVGIDVAKAAMQKKVKEIVFDRSGYKYHGRVKSLAEGARETGLKF